MAKKRTSKKKHIPKRTCVGCREVLPKYSLTRIVRTPDGIKIDSTGKLSGRGAYLHDKRSCWKRGLEGALAHALRIELAPEDRDTLNSYMESIPTENYQNTKE